MPLTPQQLADFQRLRQSYAPVLEAQRRKQQAQGNLEKMHGLPPVKPQPKAKGGKIEVRPTVFDDAASRRNPKIEEAAQALLAGNIKQKDYERLVAKEKPVKPYDFIPKPATDEQAMDVLLDRQKQNWRSHEKWPAGHRVGLRLDIPAYERHGVWVNSVHDESGGQEKFPTSYGSVSSVRNATFEGSPHKAVRVATGEQTKTPFAKIKGELEHIDEDQAIKHFQKYMNHPDYRQIGYDPRRHGDFYDRETMQSVTHAEHVVQIGPLVLAKKPKYGKRTVYAKGGSVDDGLKKFLAESKVKERLYHGTPKSFSKFKTKKGMIFLAHKPDFSNDYAGGEYTIDVEKGSPNVMPVHAHVKNPWDYQNPEHVDALHAGLSAHPHIGPEFAPSKGRISSGDWTLMEDPAVQETIKKLGHDAFFLNEGGYRNLGMYNPRNIKSAIGNRGTYDRRSSDITKAKGGRVTHAHHLEIEERPL